MLPADRLEGRLFAKVTDPFTVVAPDDGAVHGRRHADAEAQGLPRRRRAP